MDASGNDYNNDGKRSSIIDSAVDLLPIEVNIPTYEFYGSETRLNKNDEKNIMEQACEEHDLAYTKNEDRKKADLILADKAFSRLLANNVDSDEKTAALITACCMVSKITFDKCFDRVTKTIRKIAKKSRNNTKKKVRGKTEKQKKVVSE